MARGLPQPTEVNKQYIQQLVRELELRLTSIENMPKAIFGVYDYNDAGTSSTPISVTGGAGLTQLTNDALGPHTFLGMGLPNVPSIWVSDQFDFTALPLGATLDIRIDLNITTSSANTSFGVALEMANGSGSDYTLPAGSETLFKIPGTYQVCEYTSIYLGNSETRDYPALISAYSDTNVSVVVNGWYIRVAYST